MKTEDIERLLEALEETCFPVNIDWNKKDLYVKGLASAIDKIEAENRESGEAALLD